MKTSKHLGDQQNPLLLPECEWNFFPLRTATPEEQEYAVRYELDRDLGAVQLPYLLERVSQRKSIVPGMRHVEILPYGARHQEPVVVVTSAEIFRRLRWAGQRGATLEDLTEADIRELLLNRGDSLMEVAVVEIDPRYTRKQRLAALDAALTKIQQSERSKKKQGRPIDHYSQLVDLGVFRLAQTGHTNDRIRNEFKRVLNPPPSTGPAWPFPPQWNAARLADAKRRAEHALRHRPLYHKSNPTNGISPRQRLTVREWAQARERATTQLREYYSHPTHGPFHVEYEPAFLDQVREYLAGLPY